MDDLGFGEDYELLRGDAGPAGLRGDRPLRGGEGVELRSRASRSSSAAGITSSRASVAQRARVRARSASAPRPAASPSSNRIAVGRLSTP